MNTIIQNIPAKKLEWYLTDSLLDIYAAESSIPSGGWRLPTTPELLDLYASGLLPSDYWHWVWSATPFTRKSHYAECVNLGDGSIHYCNKTQCIDVAYVREIKD